MALTCAGSGGWGEVAAHRDDASASAVGPAFAVSCEYVLAAHKALRAEADDFRQFLLSVRQERVMVPCGGDPVGHDVVRTDGDRFVGAGDSYWNVCQKWVDDLYQAADSLAEIARQHGYTERDLTVSLNRSTPSA